MINVWRLSGENSDSSKLQGTQSHNGPPQFGKIYIQELDQVLTMTRRKIPSGFWQEEKKRNHFEMHQGIQFFLIRPAYPQGKLV